LVDEFEEGVKIEVIYQYIGGYEGNSLIEWRRLVFFFYFLFFL
jgi:hypothetical protein